MQRSSITWNHKLPFILAFFLSTGLWAQDTLYKRNGQVIAAKILEINVRDVSFKRSDNPDGPTYFESKNNILKIRYASGKVDSFAVTTTEERPVVNTNPYPVSPNNRVIAGPRGSIFMYNGVRLSDKELMNLAETKNVYCKNPQLDTEIKNNRKCRNIQYISGFGGLGLGLISIYGAAISTNSNSNGSTELAFMFVGVNALIASQITSMIYKSRRGYHALNVAKLYNECP